MTPVQKRLYWLILLIALVLRLSLALAWQSRVNRESLEGQTEAAQRSVTPEVTAEHLFRFGDSYSYWVLAENIAAGKAYEYGSENARIFRAPLFPLLLAPITLIPDPQVAVLVARLTCCLLGTLTVGLLMQLTCRIGGASAGLAAGTIGAVYPSAVGMSVLVLSEPLFMPLMLLHLQKWQTAWVATDWKTCCWQACQAGCLAGLAVLTRPSWLLFLPFAGVAGMVIGKSRQRHFRQRHLTILLCSLFGLCTIMSPWWVRNAMITGHFVPTTLQVGPSLYDSLHAGATGASDEGMSFMQDLVAEQAAEDRASRAPLDSTFEYRVNRRATQSAMNWAQEHPGQVLQLAIAKLARTWSMWPDGGDVASPIVRLAISVSTITVVSLAVVGSLLAVRPLTWLAGICWLPCIYFTLLHMVFVGSIRYREPGVFVLVAFAGCAVTWLAGCHLKPIDPQQHSDSRAVQRSANAQDNSTNDEPSRTS